MIEVVDLEDKDQAIASGSLEDYKTNSEEDSDTDQSMMMRIKVFIDQ